MNDTAAGKIVGGIAIACVLKLSTSVDDLIWFSPFLALCESNAERWKCSLIYVIVCSIVVSGAIVVAYAANFGFTVLLGAVGNDGTGYWDAARILSLVAAISIFGYAMKELKEWLEEGNKLPTAAFIKGKVFGCWNSDEADKLTSVVAADSLSASEVQMSAVEVFRSELARTEFQVDISATSPLAAGADAEAARPPVSEEAADAQPGTDPEAERLTQDGGEAINIKCGCS